jgi:cbb3-type cytochrome oxidase maturation protein
MDILYLLIPLSVALVLLIAGVLWYAVRSGQFDDLEGPGFKVLLDNDTPEERKEIDSEQAPRRTHEHGREGAER